MEPQGWLRPLPRLQGVCTLSVQNPRHTSPLANSVAEDKNPTLAIPVTAVTITQALTRIRWQKGCEGWVAHWDV